MIFISILITIVAIALPSFNKQLSSILLTRVSSIVFLYAGALSINACYIQSIGSGIGIYSGLFHVTIITQVIDTFIFIIGSLILISWPIISTKKSYATEYSLIVLFSTLGASLLISSADLISMYLSIELQSFGVYILSTLYKDSESATSAGLKYFLLGGLSSCLILLGSGLVYSYTGLTNFESIYTLLSVSPDPLSTVSSYPLPTHTGAGAAAIWQGLGIDLNNLLQGASLGLVLIFVGFLFKIAAAPLHNWAPDVYDDSPTIVTIWLTIMPKISILILLLELLTQISPDQSYSLFSLVNDNYSPYGNETSLNSGIGSTVKLLLLISSLLSLLIGTIVGLAQTKIKRLLAYSTISHVGFILLALAINTEQSVDSMLFYIMQYTLTNLNTFLIIIALGYIMNNLSKSVKDVNYVTGSEITDVKYIYDLKGQFFSNPLLVLSLTICLFSMAGIPPLIGFFSKQFVLYSAVQSGYYFMAIVAILVSVISASYYLKIIRVLHTESTNKIDQNNKVATSLPLSDSAVLDGNIQGAGINTISNYHSFLISSLTLTILLFVLKPSIFLNITQLLSLSLFNN